MDYNELSAREMVETIETRFDNAMGKRLSRLDPEWGTWSREMNLVLRKRIECGDTVSKLIFFYWIEHSKLLELHHKSKLMAKIKHGKHLKAIKNIRKLLLSHKI